MSNTSIRWNCSNEEYHSNRDYWGHSMLETLRSSSARAHHIYVAQDGDKPTTPALDFGGAFHCLILEPEVFQKRYAVAPFGLGVTAKGVQSRGTKEWKDWEAEIGDRKAIKTADAEVMFRMRDAVMRHPELSAALEMDHESEVGLRWKDAETGVLCKCKPDYMRAKAGIVVDLKCHGKPEAFDTVSLRADCLQRHLASKGYHRQQAHYAHGYKALTGEWPRLFLFAFVSRQRPHEVAVYRFDVEASDTGHHQRRQDYERLARILERAQTEGAEAWREDHEQGVQTIGLPRWATSGEEDAA